MPRPRATVLVPRRRRRARATFDEAGEVRPEVWERANIVRPTEPGVSRNGGREAAQAVAWIAARAASHRRGDRSSSACRKTEVCRICGGGACGAGSHCPRLRARHAGSPRTSPGRCLEELARSRDAEIRHAGRAAAASDLPDTLRFRAGAHVDETTTAHPARRIPDADSARRGLPARWPGDEAEHRATRRPSPPRLPRAPAAEDFAAGPAARRRVGGDAGGRANSIWGSLEWTNSREDQRMLAGALEAWARRCAAARCRREPARALPGQRGLRLLLGDLLATRIRRPSDPKALSGKSMMRDFGHSLVCPNVHNHGPPPCAQPRGALRRANLSIGSVVCRNCLDRVGAGFARVYTVRLGNGGFRLAGCRGAVAQLGDAVRGEPLAGRPAQGTSRKSAAAAEARRPPDRGPREAWRVPRRPAGVGVGGPPGWRRAVGRRGRAERAGPTGCPPLVGMVRSCRCPAHGGLSIRRHGRSHPGRLNPGGGAWTITVGGDRHHGGDDTWVSVAARSQRPAALKLAGARRVAVVVLGTGT